MFEKISYAKTVYGQEEIDEALIVLRDLLKWDTTQGNLNQK